MGKKKTLELNVDAIGLVVGALQDEMEHLTYRIRSREVTLTLDLRDYLEFDEIRAPDQEITEIYSTLAIQQLNPHIYPTRDGEVRQVTKFNLHYERMDDTVYVEIGIGVLNLGKIINPYGGDRSCLEGR